MSANFKRIRQEMDKLKPSFPEALDHAFQLMKKYELSEGGDSHHGLMRSIWPQYNFRNKNREWNRVRLSRLVHVEVHTLYAAAFFETPHFLVFNRASIVKHIRYGVLQSKKEEVIKLRDDGFIIQEAAKKLKVTHSTLSGFLFTNKISWPGSHGAVLPGRMKEVIKLRDGGFTREEAAKKLKVAYGTLGSFLRRNEIPWPYPSLLFGRIKEAIKLRDYGFTVAEAAKKLKVHRDTLGRFLRRNEILWPYRSVLYGRMKEVIKFQSMGLTMAEAAKKLKVPYGTLKGQLHKYKILWPRQPVFF